MSRVTGITRRYIEAMNAGDIDAMMLLFAPGAVLRHPTGVFEGSDAIRDFFLEGVFAYSAQLHYVTGSEVTGSEVTGSEVTGSERGDLAWLEVEAVSDVTPGRQRVVDVFRLDQAGRIVDVGIYSGNIVPGSDESSDDPERQKE